MNSYEFTIVAIAAPLDLEAWQDRFFEAGCDDAVLGIERGAFVIAFDREAASMQKAIESACSDVRAAGAEIRRIEPDPLVSASDIAERSSLTRQAVSLYAAGERGDGFPAPVAGITGSRPLWNWREVATWLHAKDGRLNEITVETARALDEANAALAAPASAGTPEQDQLGPDVRPLDAIFGIGTRTQHAEPSWRADLSRQNIARGRGFKLRPAAAMVVH